MKYNGFTRKAAGLMDVLWSDLGVFPCVRDDVDGKIAPEKQFKIFKGIWDTGATNSVINQSVVDSLGLVAFEKTIIRHAQGTTETFLYLVNFILPCNICVENLSVSKGDLDSDFDILIGMDVIGMGDFSVSNFQGKTAFSFRIPSVAEADFNSSPPVGKGTGGVMVF